MTKSFTITTTATDTLKADAKGHAQAVFTVTNATPRPVRGMARAKVLGNTEREWLSIAGETERDFGGGTTEQFTLNFDATGAPAGKYPFRLDVASAINPDEDFTEGQTVTVEVAGAVAPEAPKKGFPKWIFIPIAVVVLLLIGLVVWLLIPGKDTHQLGDVANTSENDARQLLESECKQGEGCVTVEISNVSDNTVAKGMAIRTEPEAGTEVPFGSNVTLFISTGAEAPTPVETTPTPTPPVKAEFSVIGTTLVANPDKHNGPCPVKITFSGSITASKAGTVKYTFVRSDKARSIVRSLDFDRADSKTVETTWQLGANTRTFNPFKGFQRIKILSPNEMESDKAEFVLHCTK